LFGNSVEIRTLGGSVWAVGVFFFFLGFLFLFFFFFAAGAPSTGSPSSSESSPPEFSAASALPLVAFPVVPFVPLTVRGEAWLETGVQTKSHNELAGEQGWTSETYHRAS